MSTQKLIYENSQQYYSEQAKNGNNLNVYQLMNGNQIWYIYAIKYYSVRNGMKC